MLVLGRRRGQSVTVTAPNGDEIVIAVVKFPGLRKRDGRWHVGGWMQIGIEAPDGYQVLRDDAIKREREEGDTCG